MEKNKKVTVTINGDTTDLETKLKEVNKLIKELNESIDELNNKSIKINIENKKTSNQ